MTKCQNCGQDNEHGTNFCRFCGTKIMFGQFQDQNEYIPPRPYSWKTDEYQIPESEGRKTQQFSSSDIPMVQPLPPPPAPRPLYQNSPYQPQAPSVFIQPQQMAPYMGGHPVGLHRCPRCNSQSIPYVKRQVSTAGWIVFSVLLVSTFIFFWIGLLLKEDVYYCPACNFRYAR